MERLVMPNVTRNDPTRMPARYQVRFRWAKFVVETGNARHGHASRSGDTVGA